jgi:hypothetical protein
MNKKESLINKISDILYIEDPLNTSCVANEATDEYYSISKNLVDLIILNEGFFEGMLEYVLSESLSLEDESVLYEFADKSSVDRVVSLIDVIFL